MLINSINNFKYSSEKYMPCQKCHGKINFGSKHDGSIKMGEYSSLIAPFIDGSVSKTQEFEQASLKKMINTLIFSDVFDNDELLLLSQAFVNRAILNSDNELGAEYLHGLHIIATDYKLGPSIRTKQLAENFDKFQDRRAGKFLNWVLKNTDTNS